MHLTSMPREDVRGGLWKSACSLGYSLRTRFLGWCQRTGIMKHLGNQLKIQHPLDVLYEEPGKSPNRTVELKAWLERSIKERVRRSESNKYTSSRNVAFEGKGNYSVTAYEDRKVGQRVSEEVLKRQETPNREETFKDAVRKRQN